MADTQELPRWKLSDLMGRLSAALPTKHADEPAPAPVMVSVREEHEDERDVAAAVPRTLRVAAAISWRTLVVAGLVLAVLWGIARLTLVIMPVAIALTVAVLLDPLVSWMRRRLHFPSSLAATDGLLVFFAAVAGALSQAAAELIQQVPYLAQQAAEGFRALLDAIVHNEFLQNGPLKIDTTVLTAAAEQLRSELVNWLNSNKETLATGALSITSSVGTLATSGLTMLFCLFFFLKEGRSIWLWCVRLLPAPARVPVHESAIRGWATFGSYVRTQIQVAAIDALGIALGAFFLGVPLAIPIGVITFFAAFVPILGALTSGVIAVLVAAVNPCTPSPSCSSLPPDRRSRASRAGSSRCRSRPSSTRPSCTCTGMTRCPSWRPLRIARVALPVCSRRRLPPPTRVSPIRARTWLVQKLMRMRS